MASNEIFISCSKIFIIFNGKNSNFTLKKPGDIISEQSKLISQNCVLTIDTLRREHSFSPVIFLPRYRGWIQLRRNTHKPKLRDVLQNDWPAVFKSIFIIRDKERLKFLNVRVNYFIPSFLHSIYGYLLLPSTLVYSLMCWGFYFRIENNLKIYAYVLSTLKSDLMRYLSSLFSYNCGW